MLRAARELISEVEGLRFGPPVTHIYNPLEYAWAPFEQYVRRYGAAPKQAILLGMNPGPFGMVQTGVPFGEVSAVRDWLGIEAPVGHPPCEHPRRPVLGFGCPRTEISGLRLWGWARNTFGTPDRFFARFFVANYCPLSFLEATGRNRTPDKLTPTERRALYQACDRHLRRIEAILKPERVIGIGAFAEARAREALSGMPVGIGRVSHPSPASPKANRGWSELISQELVAQGLDLPK